MWFLFKNTRACEWIFQQVRVLKYQLLKFLCLCICEQKKLRIFTLYLLKSGIWQSNHFLMFMSQNLSRPQPINVLHYIEQRMKLPLPLNTQLHHMQSAWFHQIDHQEWLNLSHTFFQQHQKQAQELVQQNFSVKDDWNDSELLLQWFSCSQQAQVLTDQVRLFLKELIWLPLQSLNTLKRVLAILHQSYIQHACWLILEVFLEYIFQVAGSLFFGSPYVEKLENGNYLLNADLISLILAIPVWNPASRSANFFGSGNILVTRRDCLKLGL